MGRNYKAVSTPSLMNQKTPDVELHQLSPIKNTTNRAENSGILTLTTLVSQGFQTERKNNLQNSLKK